jgi:hypothetical protein
VCRSPQFGLVLLRKSRQNKTSEKTNGCMKKAFLLGILLATQFFAAAQDNWGKIILKNIGIPKSDGSGTYDVPIRDYINRAGLGAYNGGATLGLFLADNSPFAQPFATAAMGTSASESPYATVPASQTVTVPGYAPGSRAVIIIRAWVGPNWGAGAATGEWVFTTPPLGGIPPEGGPEIPTPSLTGWGPEDGSGLIVTPWPPRAYVSSPRDGAVFAAPASIKITAGYGGDPGCTATNFAVYAGPVLVTNTLLNAGTPGSYLTPPLGAGTYSIYSVVHAGYGSGPQFIFTGATESLPMNITVVDPVEITLTTPSIATGQVSFQYTVNPGLTYTIQTSSDLKTWQTVETNKPTSSPAVFTRAMSADPAVFYQVQLVPNP